MKNTIELNSLDDTKELARGISKMVGIGDVIALIGDLGAGKTTFAKFFINSFYDKPEEVLSPTFNIVLTYDLPQFTIWHFDLYRIEDKAELVEIGLEEALSGGITLIEWPQIAESVLPEDVLYVKLLYLNDGNTRIASLDGKGKWEQRLKSINV